jgi:hypothetical protein
MGWQTANCFINYKTTELAYPELRVFCLLLGNVTHIRIYGVFFLKDLALFIVNVDIFRMLSIQTK